MSQPYGLVGAAWRAEFFLRISKELPELFPCSGIVVRDPEKRDAVHSRWGVPVFGTIDEMLAASKPAYVITSVSWSANLPIMESLAARGVPVLSETPIAPSLEDLHRVFELAQAGAKIQLAEQYLFQPLHAARLNLVNSGRLGPVREADVSYAHGYHGVSLIRNYLQTGLRLPVVTARKFKSRIVASRDRGGPPSEKRIVDTERTIATLDYGDKLGVFDFTGDQYFSWVRSHRLMVRGEEGEINNTTVRLLRDFKTPIQFNLLRQDTGETGNLEGKYLRAILGGAEILYENPFPGARLNDDEVAIATAMQKMLAFVAGGDEFYGVPEACHDRYLDILIEESAKSGQPMQAVAQPWCA